VSWAEGSISGKAFAGAEITIGGKAAVAWNKKSPESYQSAIEHYATLALGLNPLTMPFAPAAVAVFKLYPELVKGVAPALMGEAGAVDVAAVEASVTGTAGAGAKGAIDASFKNGKVSFKASGEGTLGFGGGADVKVEADPVEAMRLGAAAQGGLLAELTSALSDKSKELADRAGVVWDEIVLAIATNVGRLQAFISKCGDKGMQVLLQIWDKLVAAGMSVKDLVKAAWDSTTDGVAALGDLLAKAGSDAIAPLWDAVKGSTSNIVAFAQAVVTNARSHTTALLDLLWDEDWDVLGAVWGGSGKTLQGLLFAFIKDKGWGKLGKLLANATAGISPLIQAIWDACRMENLVEVFAAAKGQWQALLDFVWSNSSWEQIGRMIGAAGGAELVSLAKGIYAKSSYSDFLWHLGSKVLALVT